MRSIGCATAALALAACASGARGDREPAPTVSVTVENNGAIAGTVRISLVPQSGQEIRLGRTSTFGSEVVRGRVPAFLVGAYRLRAVASSGRSLISPVIQVRAGDRLHWDLRLNTVRSAEP